MRCFIFQAALLFASATALQTFGKRQPQQEDGAFVPDTTTVLTCAASGPGYLDCGTDYCYNPDIGETCCTEGYFCTPDSFCLGGGLCCPNGMTESACLSQLGLTAVPTFSRAAATSTGVEEDSTATATASTTRRATITGGSSEATQTAGSSNGGGSNVVGFGAVLAAVGGAALAL